MRVSNPVHFILAEEIRKEKWLDGGESVFQLELHDSLERERDGYMLAR